MCHFLGLVGRCFLRVLGFPPIFHWVILFLPIDKLEANAISILSEFIAEQALGTTGPD